MDIRNTKMNLHNHTCWSDGDNTPEELVQTAVSIGMDVVGISDHLDTRKGYKLTLSNIHQYSSEVKVLSCNYPIEVLCGVEIDIQLLIKSSDESLYKSCNQLDYILIEDIEFLSNSIGLNDLDKFIRLFSCPVGLAHTNLYKLSQKYGSLSFVIEFMKRNDLFWEINASNVYGFFDNIIYGQLKPIDIELLSELKKAKIMVTVGSDTHSLVDLEKGRLFAANDVARKINLG